LSDHEVGAQTLADDVVTSPPLPATGAGTQGYVGDVRASTSLPIIDVEPINSVPSTSAQDPTADPIQIEQLQENPETSGVQVPGSTPTGLTLRHEEIDWTRTPCRRTSLMTTRI
jgi:hypothetical protein